LKVLARAGATGTQPKERQDNGKMREVFQMTKELTVKHGKHASHLGYQRDLVRML
jgi:hypothetical protein